MAAPLHWSSSSRAIGVNVESRVSEHSIVNALEACGGVAIITADHGNAEKMLDEHGEPFTAHTTNPVPLIVTDKSVKLRKEGILSDVTPTLLDLLEIEAPADMTAKSLIVK